jgi:hypothetical protein
MKININDKTCNIFFDKTGNVFIKSNNDMYILEIDNANNISLLKDENYNTDDNDDAQYLTCDGLCDGICNICPTKISKLCVIPDPDNKNNGDDKNDDDKYYPENKNLLDIKDDDLQEDTLRACYDDHQFIFSSVKQNFDIEIINSDDFVALYDTFIYEGEPDGNELIFVSSCDNNVKLMYRLLIYTSGHFYFRPTGEIIKKNKLIISDDGALMFEKIVLN